MPQLIFSDYAPQLAWLAISFIGLYLVLAYMALPRISEVLENRQVRIANDLDDAERLKGEAEDALDAYEGALAEARGNAHDIALETRTRVAGETERRKAELASTLAGQAEEAESKIETARAEALEKVRDVAEEAAAAVIAKLIGEEVPQPAVVAAIEAELAGRKG